MKIRQAVPFARLRPVLIFLSMLLVTRSAAAQDAEAPGPFQPSDSDSSVRFHGGFGLHVYESAIPYRRWRSLAGSDTVRSYPRPGFALSLDLELQGSNYLLGVSGHFGGGASGTEPGGIASLHVWLAYILGGGDIAPYLGVGAGGLIIFHGEGGSAGLAGNATLGVLFFRSNKHFRPELTLQVFLPAFDASDHHAGIQQPTFWPIALLGFRLLI